FCLHALKSPALNISVSNVLKFSFMSGINYFLKRYQKISRAIFHSSSLCAKDLSIGGDDSIGITCYR
ncbi:hypothetical protein, partial [Klebsiella grimontii]|uniref:hypothetical protein n=1 Tax=Klebsiella grimontii TaxID=2058152 RepID=UPI001C49C249